MRLRNYLFGLLCGMALLASAGEAYRDQHVRFTVIYEGTLRLEYAPDGKFVDNKSFVAVVRDYDAVPFTLKESGGKVTITTSKMKLVYKKGNEPFNAKNLTITAAKQLGTAFTWSPGTKQQGNLKGTYRTLDGYNGNMHRRSGKTMPSEYGLLSTDGWTLVDDSQGLLFDGDKDWDWVTQRTSAEGSQDWYFMAYGHDYKAALKSYTRFAGRVPLPPRYTFGYWWSRYWSYSDQDFRDLVANFEKGDIPLDVLVIDMDWHPINEVAGGGWTGWDWNERLFPDYKQFLNFLTEHGIKKTMNLHPADGVRPYEKKYKEFCQRYGKPEGKAYEWLGSDKKFIKAIFDTYLHPYINEGVDFWWLDWQQWLNDKAMPQLSNTWWCNYVFFSDMERTGGKRPMLYHRWGGLGNHRYQIGFSGDSYITWESLKFLPYFNSTASNVLYGYWSHDIGGHMTYDKPGVPVELYPRSVQMGQYLPVLRTHSTKDASLNKEPWAFEQDVQDRLKAVINGRYALVPYIYTMARQTYDTGVSLCRPMYYDYPESQEAYSAQSQYMFGDAMMIAPITQEVDKADGFARIKVWLPEGEWIEAETGTMLTGGTTVERAFNINEYPVYIKAGSILPYYGKVRNLNGTSQPVTVRVWPGKSEGEFTMYEDNGEDCDYATSYATTLLSYKRNGNHLSINIAPRKGNYKDMPARRRYSVALPCAMAPASVTVGGKPVKFGYDGYSLETSIDLGEVDCAAGVTVEVEYGKPEYALADGTKARFNRVRQAVAQYKQANCGMVYSENFGYLEAAPLRMMYFPEQQAATMARFNQIYDQMPLVLLQQMGKKEHIDRFMRTIDLDATSTIEDMPASVFRTTDGRQGWDVKYFNNRTMEGNAVATAHCDVLQFNTEGTIMAGVNTDDWSLVASSTIEVDKEQDIFFECMGDDGYRLYVDNKLVLSDWSVHGTTRNNAMLSLKPGHKYDLRIEYFDDSGFATLGIIAKRLNPKQ